MVWHIRRLPNTNEGRARPIFRLIHIDYFYYFFIFFQYKLPVFKFEFVAFLAAYFYGGSSRFYTVCISVIAQFHYVALR